MIKNVLIKLVLMDHFFSQNLNVKLLMNYVQLKKEEVVLLNRPVKKLMLWKLVQQINKNKIAFGMVQIVLQKFVLMLH